MMATAYSRKTPDSQRKNLYLVSTVFGHFYKKKTLISNGYVHFPREHSLDVNVIS